MGAKAVETDSGNLQASVKTAASECQGPRCWMSAEEVARTANTQRTNTWQRNKSTTAQRRSPRRASCRLRPATARVPDTLRWNSMLPKKPALDSVALSAASASSGDSASRGAGVGGAQGASADAPCARVRWSGSVSMTKTAHNPVKKENGFVARLWRRPVQRPRCLLRGRGRRHC